MNAVQPMKKAFTLIELLVVIAIIAILAAILFPVFAQAKAAAKKSSDLSNTKQLGISLQLYITDYDDVYPTTYYYRNDSGSGGTAPNCGYVHWSGMIQPYVKNKRIFVSPGDALNGLAPTNYDTTNNNQGEGAPGGQADSSSCSIADDQVPRLSYIPNSLIMPRKRRTADPMTVTSATAIDGVSSTILLGPMTDVPTCINDTSSASGTDWKTHRPANALFLQDGTTAFSGEPLSHVGLSYYYAATVADAKYALETCQTSATGALGLLHLAYTSPYRFGGSHKKVTEGGANYVFADTSAKFKSIGATLNPSNFLWGTKAYTAGGGQVLRKDNNQPVQ